MTTLKEKIGEAVRTARKSYKGGGLTQMQLAERADVSMETISNVERGATLPTVDVLFKIARVLPLDLAALAKALPTGQATSKERLRLETSLVDITHDLPDDKLKSLIEIARVLKRQGT